MSNGKSKAIKEADALIETSAADADTIEASAVTTTDETLDEATSKVFDATLQVADEGVEKAIKDVEASQAKLSEILTKTVKNSGEILAFSHGNFEAVLKSTEVYTTGFQDISKQLKASSEASFDGAIAFTKSLIWVKSGKEAFELQTVFIKASIESALAERKKVIEAIAKLTEQAFAPLSIRFTVALETLGKTH